MGKWERWQKIGRDYGGLVIERVKTGKDGFWKGLVEIGIMGLFNGGRMLTGNIWKEGGAWIVDWGLNYEKELIQSNHSWGIPFAGCGKELGNILHKNTSVQSDSKGNWQVWTHLETSTREMKGIRRSQLRFFRSGFSQSFRYRFSWCFRWCFIPWNTLWNWVWNCWWNTWLKHYMKHFTLWNMHETQEISWNIRFRPCFMRLKRCFNFIVCAEGRAVEGVGKKARGLSIAICQSPPTP